MIEFIIFVAILIVATFSGYRVGQLNKELDFINYIAHLNRGLTDRFVDIEDYDVQDIIIKAEADILIEILKYFEKGGVKDDDVADDEVGAV